MNPAEYCSYSPGNSHHYAISFDYYTHFTSPIRWYSIKVTYCTVMGVIDKCIIVFVQNLPRPARNQWRLSGLRRVLRDRFPSFCSYPSRNVAQIVCHPFASSPPQRILWRFWSFWCLWPQRKLIFILFSFMSLYYNKQLLDQVKRTKQPFSSRRPLPGGRSVQLVDIANGLHFQIPAPEIGCMWWTRRHQILGGGGDEGYSIHQEHQNNHRSICMHILEQRWWGVFIVTYLILSSAVK